MQKAATEAGGTDNGNGDARASASPMMVIGAIGVVFGDIGTSTLYTFNAAFSDWGGMPANTTNVLGVLSLVLWTLAIVVALKYVTFIMRADNNGEGGIIAMMALAQRAATGRPRTGRLVMLAAMAGAALFFGDGVITPSITVLSAIEGLEVATPALSRWVVWIAIGVLLALFWVQKRGTEKIGKIFGPIMCVWFVAQALVGLYNIVPHPLVLRAFNPWYGINFFIQHGGWGFLILGAVVLCTTGAEALYADMGHFGRKPITVAWYAVVLPGVMLNYLGQAAVLIHNPAAVSNPFFLAAPGWALYPMVVLATAAAVIASQSVISGAFSMMNQAIQLGFMPRMRVIHTSSDEIGQIYLPGINTALMILVVLTVIGFGSSTALAAAYGIAVTGTMASTTLLFAVVALWMWKWKPAVVMALGVFFLTVDLSFFGANLVKVVDGGWFPLALGVLVFTIMTTWARGRLLLGQQLGYKSESLEVFVKRLEQDPPYRIPGTAVFFTGDKGMAPARLMQHLERHRVLQERVLLVTVEISDVPRVPATDRMTLVGVAPGITRVVVRYGFMQQPNLPVVLKLADKLGLDIDSKNMTYYVGRETLVPDVAIPGMALWRDRLFSFLSRNARPATSYYGLPPEDVVELGFQVKI